VAEAYRHVGLAPGAADDGQAIGCGWAGDLPNLCRLRFLSSGKYRRASSQACVTVGNWEVLIPNSAGAANAQSAAEWCSTTCARQRSTLADDDAETKSRVVTTFASSSILSPRRGQARRPLAPAAMTTLLAATRSPPRAPASAQTWTWKDVNNFTLRTAYAGPCTTRQSSPASGRFGSLTCDQCGARTGAMNEGAPTLAPYFGAYPSYDSTTMPLIATSPFRDTRRVYPFSVSYTLTHHGDAVPTPGRLAQTSAEIVIDARVDRRECAGDSLDFPRRPGSCKVHKPGNEPGGMERTYLRQDPADRASNQCTAQSPGRQAGTTSVTAIPPAFPNEALSHGDRDHERDIGPHPH